MTALTLQDLEHLSEALRKGLVPGRGLDTIAVSIEKQRGELAEAGALISWLCGSGNVAASAKKSAGIKGDIESRNALDYLRGVLEIVKAVRHRGLVIVIDEAETILRMRKDTRRKSLNGIRQIADAAGSYPGLLWVFTGTRSSSTRARAWPDSHPCTSGSGF